MIKSFCIELCMSPACSRSKLVLAIWYVAGVLVLSVVLWFSLLSFNESDGSGAKISFYTCFEIKKKLLRWIW